MTRALLYLVLSVAPLVGCELWDTPMSDPDCRDMPVDVDTELLLSQAWLRSDVRAKNELDGAFSFAGQLAALRQRYPGFDARQLWSLLEVDEATPAARLPFRLLALVNRTDLAEQLAPESPAGEARLVYTLTQGSGDNPGSAALPLTIIFEYSLGSNRSARDWAADFHALARLNDADAAKRLPATEALVESFVSPMPAEGSPYLSQLRVNDARYGVPRLYELAVDRLGVVAPRGLRNTPRPELADTPALVTFAREHADDIARGAHRVPQPWLADSASVEPITWLSAAPHLDHDFSRGTCSGCHGIDGPSADGFHLSEAQDGSVTRSRFLTDEDLPRRAQTMRGRLCEN